MKCMCTAAIAVIMGMSTMAFVQPEKKPAGQPEIDAKAAAEQAAWEQAGTPGPHHKHMEAMVGTWDTKSSFWMAPGTEPMVSTAIMTNEMVLGGRHMTHHYKGDVMGMPFEGRGSMSYDNIAKEYTTTWMDSMSTGVMVSKGQCDASGKVFTFKGEMLEPNGKKSITREVLTVKDNNSHTMEMYVTGEDGKEFKNMEFIYTRKGAAAATPAAKPATPVKPATR
jgi:hypothetical protein